MAARYIWAVLAGEDHRLSKKDVAALEATAEGAGDAGLCSVRTFASL
jgi:hypothetical protein